MNPNGSLSKVNVPCGEAVYLVARGEGGVEAAGPLNKGEVGMRASPAAGFRLGAFPSSKALTDPQAGKQPSSGTNRPVPGMRATGDRGVLFGMAVRLALRPHQLLERWLGAEGLFSSRTWRAALGTAGDRAGRDRRQ